MYKSVKKKVIGIILSLCIVTATVITTLPYEDPNNDIFEPFLIGRVRTR